MIVLLVPAQEKEHTNLIQGEDTEDLLLPLARAVHGRFSTFYDLNDVWVVKETVRVDFLLCQRRFSGGCACDALHGILVLCLRV